MISEFFINLWSGFVTWLLGLIPDWDIPSEIADLDTDISAFLAQFANVGIWVPWAVVTGCVLVALLAWVIAFGIKGAAWVYGQVPVFGGAG